MQNPRLDATVIDICKKETAHDSCSWRDAISVRDRLLNATFVLSPVWQARPEHPHDGLDHQSASYTPAAITTSLDSGAAGVEAAAGASASRRRQERAVHDITPAIKTAVEGALSSATPVVSSPPPHFACLGVPFVCENRAPSGSGSESNPGQSWYLAVFLPSRTNPTVGSSFPSATGTTDVGFGTQAGMPMQLITCHGSCLTRRGQARHSQPPPRDISGMRWRVFGYDRAIPRA